MIQTEHELSLQVSDLEVQVHDVHSDVNDIASEVRELQDRVGDLEWGEDMNDISDITWVTEHIQDAVLDNLDTTRMVGSRYQRRRRYGGSRAYFGQWFGPGIGKTWYRWRYRKLSQRHWDRTSK